MALILNIDTATENGSVCLAKDGVPLADRKMESQKDHSALTIPFIRDMLKEVNVNIREMEAVAVSGGPGSYTGLRVGTATAKGLCFALDIPLIAINTLEMMAAGYRSMIQLHDQKDIEILYNPVIDARRMEVFTALYNRDLEAIISPAAMVLHEDFLLEYRQAPVYIFGTARDKARDIFKNNKVWHFPDFTCNASYLAPLAEVYFKKGDFQNLAYFEPFYLKSFYRPAGSK